MSDFKKIIKNFAFNVYLLIAAIRGVGVNEDSLQLKLAQIIINSTDPEELKNKIVREIAIALNASRCFFIEYDSSTNNFKKVTNSYNTQRDDISMLGYSIENSLPRLSMKQKYMTSLVIEDTEQFVKTNKLTELDEDNYFKTYNIKASLTVRLDFGETFLGVLVVHYSEKKPFLQNFDLKFLEKIAEHISIALHLSTLYAEEKTKKEKERLLRSIISVMGKYYDLSEIILKVFIILGKIYNTQSIFINVDMDNFKNTYHYNLPSGNEQPLIEIYGLPIFDSTKKKTHYIADTHNFIIQNNLENSETEEYFKVYNIKSLIMLPITFENLSIGLLVMHFDKLNQINKEDIDFIKTVLEQLAIAIKQAQIYEEEKKTAQRESLLREITETIRSSLNVDETLSFICSEIIKVFKVQRAAINMFPNPKNCEAFIMKKELTSSDEIKRFPKNNAGTEIAAYWGSYLSKNNKILAFDSVEKSDAPDYFKNSYKEMDVKSIIGTPIKKGDDTWGAVILSEYKNGRHWTNEEKSLLEIIANQIYIAINQAELYEKEKKAAERERVLKDIISKMRNSLDIEDTLAYICTETAKLFNVQRTTIVSLEDSESLSDFKVRKEYKVFPEIRGLSDVNDFSKAAAFWWASLMKLFPIIAIDNIEKSKAPDEFKNAYISIGVKSVMATAIKKDEKIWGSLVLSEYNEYRNWTDEEKTLLSAIADQVYLSINQAELFAKEKEAAETEKFNRKILEILRSTLDKTTIKNLFVKNIGKHFQADRVFFADYDPKAKKFLPVEEKSEYLSSTEEKSFINYDWSDESMNEYIQPLLEKRELKIFCWEDYIKENKKGQGFISRFEDARVNSSYNFPVIYEGGIIGYFCIEYTKETCNKLSEADVNRIRSMCTQAGIALYHAELYLKARHTAVFNETYIENISQKIEAPTKSILDSSTKLSQNEFPRNVQIEYLDSIINSCDKLLELTKNISDH